MPLYDFGCARCGASFERMLPLDRADDVTTCACGATARRRIASVAFLGGSRPPVPARRMLPSSLQGVGGTREGITRQRRIEESVSRFESAHPEVVEQRRPVLSHENGRVVYAQPSPPAA